MSTISPKGPEGLQGPQQMPSTKEKEGTKYPGKFKNLEQAKVKEGKRSDGTSYYYVKVRTPKGNKLLIRLYGPRHKKLPESKKKDLESRIKTFAKAADQAHKAKVSTEQKPKTHNI